MNRRSFLVTGLGSLAGGGGSALAQTPDSTRQSIGPAPQGDRLFRPDAVQQRPVATSADNDAEIQAIERRLKCTCGCNLDIYTCRTTDFTCTYSPELHREVLALREGGKTADQIVEAFVAKYGEQVLMAPKPEGFNLAGYLVPGAVLLAAGGLLAFVLMRRSRMLAVSAAGAGTAVDGDGRRRASSPVPPATARDISPEDAERLRHALSEVED